MKKKEINTPPLANPKRSLDAVRAIAIRAIHVEDDPKEILKRFDETITCLIENKTEGQEGKVMSELADKAMNVVGLDNHYPIAETITRNRPLVIEFANQLAEEYQCKTQTEKSLVEVIAGSFGRILEYSKLFNNCFVLFYMLWVYKNLSQPFFIKFHLCSFLNVFLV